MRLFLYSALTLFIFCHSLLCQIPQFDKNLKWEKSDQKVFLFSFTPDGRFILLVKRFNWNLIDLDSNSDMVGEIEVIETATGKSLSNLKVCDGKFSLGLSFFDGGISKNNKLAVSCRKGTSEIWDIENAKLLQTIFPSVAKEIDSYTLSPNGKHLVTFENDNFQSTDKAVLWDVEKGKRIGYLAPNLGGNFATNAAFSSDGKTVAVSYDGFVYLWNTSNGDLIHKFTDDSLKDFPTRSHFSGSLVYVLLFTPDGKRLLTSATDKFAKIWNTETGKLEYDLGSHKSRIDMGTLSADGKLAAIMGDNKEIEFREIETGKLLQKFKATSNSYIGYSFSPDNKYFFSPTVKGASVWEVKTGKEIWSEKSNRTALSSSWKWYLSYDKKQKKLRLFEIKFK